MNAPRWILTLSLVAAAALLIPLAGSAQIPPPSPPACVSGCDNDDGGAVPARQPTCRTINVTYACGTQEKCDDLPGRGIVCVEVERMCSRSEEICD
jgi:hypothetical protein